MSAVATKKRLSKSEFIKSSKGWQQSFLKIVDKQGQLVPLKHNIAQLKVQNTMRLQLDNNLPVMLIILKARQEGVSTYIEACIFEHINRKPNRHGCIVSADKDSTEKVFRMCKTFQDEMLEGYARELDKSNAKEVRYKAPHRSSMLCQTAGKRVLGRGGTTQYVHATEVAFWANAKTQLLGLLQEVPEDPDTMVIQETTANGVGGAFYETYWAAVERLRNNPEDYAGYIPIFLPWQIFPEYQTPLPSEFKGVLNLEPEVDEYFKERMSRGLSFSPEQMYWAVLKIRNRCGGDIELFKQEYPSSAREAFQSTGRMVFRPIELDQMEHHCKPPIVNIEFYMEGADVKYRHVNRRANCWSVWKWPQSNHGYCCFGDVAEGVLSNPDEPKSDPDRSVAAILDRNDFDVPATYYGRPDTIEFADQMIMAAKFFNYAWASPEMNSIGQSVLDAFKRDDYQYIYLREHKEDTYVTRDTKELLGWKTTTKTRKPMIADLQTVVNEQELKVYDIRFISEMRVFIWNPQGKPQAEKGEHDDCVITLAGLLQLHQRCPVAEDFSWAGQDKAESNIDTLAIMGAIAPDDDDEDDLDLLYEDSSEYE